MELEKSNILVIGPTGSGIYGLLYETFNDAAGDVIYDYAVILLASLCVSHSSQS